MLEARALTKRYGDTPALHDFSHAFAEGKITTILGPSGSGKSTALSLIAGLKQPDSGSVWLNGRDITSVPPERRDFGTVFQSYALFPHLNVRENVEFGLRVRRIPKPERRARAIETLELTRIAHLAERRITEISGGQQQRVAVARALAGRPEIIFADEPTGNLDSHSGAEILSFMRRAVTELGQTIVMVTHDPVAASYADQVLFLADGRIVDEMPEPTADRVLERMKAFDRDQLIQTSVPTQTEVR